MNVYDDSNDPRSEWESDDMERDEETSDMGVVYSLPLHAPPVMIPVTFLLHKDSPLTSYGH